MKIYRVTLSGRGRAGKTSLMAAVYAGNNVGDSPVVAEPETRELLSARGDDLRAACAGNLLSVPAGIAPTTEPVEFRFQVGQGSKRPAQLVFRDAPGNSAGEGRSADDGATIAESDAHIVAIDLPSLIESPGGVAIHQEYAGHIAKLLTSAWGQSERNRLLVLTPVKCERYLFERPQEIGPRVRQAYQPLLEAQAETPLVRRSVVMLIPVQTTGVLVYSYLHMTDGVAPQPIYRKTRADAEWAPWGGDRLLRSLVGFLAAREIAEERTWYRRLGKIGEVIARHDGVWYRDPAVVAWLSQPDAAASRPRRPSAELPIDVIQGRDLLGASLTLAG